MVIAVRLWISRHWLNAVVDGRRHIVRIDALAYGFTVDEVLCMQTAAAVVATSYGSRRALPRTRSDGLLCLSGSYSRLLQGQKLPTGLRVLSVRFARSRPESRPAAFGQLGSLGWSAVSDLG